MGLGIVLLVDDLLASILRWTPLFKRGSNCCGGSRAYLVFTVENGQIYFGGFGLEFTMRMIEGIPGGAFEDK